MYMIPHNFKCPKCESQFKWSIDCDHIGLGQPLCPVCYLDFIHKNVPVALRHKESEDKE